MTDSGRPPIGGIDLASRWLGASVLAASDESFGDKENLLKPEPAAFEPGRYGNRGELVDGWETRRRREPGNDWALVRLGAPGTIARVDVDTSFFTGNFPESVRIDACGVEGYPSPDELLGDATEWVEIVPRSPLRGDAHNTFTVTDPRRYTHVRLSMFPDGGVARLRVGGTVVPDPRLVDELTIDLASQEWGGLVVDSSDGFYGSAGSLNRPGRARTMGEGWETRRRRDGGHDLVLIRLAFVGEVRQLVIDTAHFKYNASAAVEVSGRAMDSAPLESDGWDVLLPRTRLQPDTRHLLPIEHGKLVASIRVDAYPDGGLSRVRVIGAMSAEARRVAGYRWFNSMPRGQAAALLVSAGLEPSRASEIAADRPLSGSWLKTERDRASSVREEALAIGRLSVMLEGLQPTARERRVERAWRTEP